MSHFRPALFFHCVCALVVLTLLLCLPLPGVSVPEAWAGMVAVTVLAQIMFRRLCPQGTGGEYVITAASTIMAVGITLNVYYFTAVSGGTDSAPVLVNDDACRTWNDALARLGRGGELMDSSHSFFGAVIALVVLVFGQSIMSVLIYQMTMVLGALVFCGGICRRMGMAGRATVMAVGSLAAVCYFLGSGMVLTKDATVFLIMALAGYALSGERINNLALAVAAFLALVVRPGFLPMIAAGLIFTALAVPRDRRNWWRRAVWIILLAALFLLPEVYKFAPAIGGRLSSQRIVDMAPQQYAYYNLAGDYYHLAFWKRILLLPVSVVTQFLIPFPWNFMRDTVFGYSLVYSHISYPWYAFGALLLYYLAKGRKYGSRRVLVVALWGVFCWIVPCYTDGGTISRYALPALSLMAPAVGITLDKCLKLRSLHIWMAVFAILLGFTLYVCHGMQSRAAAGAVPEQRIEILDE